MKMRALVRSALAAVGLVTCIASAAHAETLKWGDWMAQGSTEHAKTAEWLSNEISRRSGGKHKLQMLWGGTVVTVGEVPTAIENGVIDMGALVTPYFPDQFPINNALPFFWPQPKSQKQLGDLMLSWHEKYKAFGDELDKYNLKLVSVRPLASYGIICTTPVRTLADFKGKRIRSYGIALPAMLEALGAVPVSMADVDAYEALSNGVLDCSPADPGIARGFKYEEKAKYFIDVPMGASWGHIIVINKDKYAALPDDLKKIIDDMKHDYLDEYLKVYDQAVNEVREGWKKNGNVEIIPFPAEEFLNATLKNPRVQAVRDSWIPRAVKAGLPEDQARQVVNDINN
jgi:TRAP-type C4-dicarboxylate transport system substrate-binding protein